MKRKIFALGLLSISHFASAQSLLYVSDQASVHIKESALVYNGGEVKTKASGVVDNFGNVMIVGGGLKTVTASDTPKTNGGNFILRLWSSALNDSGITNGGTNTKYGQLYINGVNQNEVTGIVDKEYKDNSHGRYQQISVPFYQKKFSELSTELGAGFTNNRWTRTEILVWNNRMVRFDNIDVNANTSTLVDNRLTSVPTRYYAVGTANFNAFTGSGNSTTGTRVYTIKGVPFAPGFTETMFDAGKGIDFGATGGNANWYQEKYNTYLYDPWDYSSNNVWKNDYGRNMYYFGNPYLTNLDLRQLNALIPNIQGVKIEAASVDAATDTVLRAPAYIDYTAGVPVGDLRATVRPLGTFVIKLRGNASSTSLNLDNLRRFKYSGTAASGVNSQSKQDETLTTFETNSIKTLDRGSINLSSSSVKQLGVVAIDASGNEIGRTYYVVHTNGFSGQPLDKKSTQITADSRNIIGTFEEAKTGGVDESLTNSYWLYINETNEVDFKGKQVPLRLYDNKIKSLKFEILENAEVIADGQERLSSGESFHIFDGKKYVTIGNNKSIPVSSIEAEFGLYYGTPVEKNPTTTLATLEKPSSTILAYDESLSAYKILFDPEWKKATVQIFDLSGRLISSQSNVDASNDHVIKLPNNVKATFIVTAVSDTGKKFSQKVINK